MADAEADWQCQARLQRQFGDSANRIDFAVREPATWDGGDGQARLPRRRRCLRSDAHARMVDLLRWERLGLQPVLFCSLTWPSPL